MAEKKKHTTMGNCSLCQEFHLCPDSKFRFFCCKQQESPQQTILYNDTSQQILLEKVPKDIEVPIELTRINEAQLSNIHIVAKRTKAEGEFKSKYSKDDEDALYFLSVSSRLYLGIDDNVKLEDLIGEEISQFVPPFIFNYLYPVYHKALSGQHLEGKLSLPNIGQLLLKAYPIKDRLKRHVVAALVVITPFLHYQVNINDLVVHSKDSLKKHESTPTPPDPVDHRNMRESPPITQKMPSRRKSIS